MCYSSHSNPTIQFYRQSNVDCKNILHSLKVILHRIYIHFGFVEIEIVRHISELHKILSEKKTLFELYSFTSHSTEIIRIHICIHMTIS